MKFLYFTHSLVSDWNNGNAHFQRGLLKALQRAGHEAEAFEAENGWSVQNLRAAAGPGVEAEFARRFPTLKTTSYTRSGLDLDAVLEDADVVLVHEWNEPWLVAALGRARARGGRFLLFFHDTHHRAVSDPGALDAFELDSYDGILAFGDAIREIYEGRGWSRRAWTWHEAADADLFRPTQRLCQDDDLVWIGNWGDDERSRELREFLIEPASRLGLNAQVFGVRYPAEAIDQLRASGIRYGGWLANAEVPSTFARHRVTVHVPRRFYAEHLPGIPTIRVFEALACGIPLVSAPWQDSESLFPSGTDFLMAKNGEEMQRRLKEVLADSDLRHTLARHGLETIRARHTCAHRAEELLGICRLLGAPAGESERVVA